MNKEKPKKTVYPNQEKIYKKIIDILKNKYLPKFSKVYLTGSVASKTFGKYESEYEGYMGSDVDIMGVLKVKIPNSWRYKGIKHGWYREYLLGEIEVESINHPINLIMPLKNDINLFLNKMKELNKKVLRLK